jgi:hypothetical protein
MQQSADKGQTAHGETFIYPVVMARKWGLTKAIKDKDVSGQKAPQHSSPASRDCFF